MLSKLIATVVVFALIGLLCRSWRDHDVTADQIWALYAVVGECLRLAYKVVVFLVKAVYFLSWASLWLVFILPFRLLSVGLKAENQKA